MTDEQIKIDAARYRYLRDTEMWGVIIWEALDFPDDHGGHSHALDQAVDASMKQSEGENDE